MNNLIKRFFLMVLSVSFFGLSAEAWAQSILLRRYRGDVEITNSQGRSLILSKDLFVPPGSTIVTKASGRCILAGSDGSVFKISPESRVEVSSLMGGKNEETSTTSLLLAMGHLNAEVQKALGADETVRVVTMAAVAGVRGTAFDVVVGADGQTVVQVSEGLVAVDSDQSGTVEVAPGRQVRADQRRVGEVREAETREDWREVTTREGNRRLLKEAKRSFDGAREGVKRRELKLQRVRMDLRRAVKTLKAARASGSDAATLKRHRLEVRRLRAKLNRLIEQSMVTVGWSEAVASLLDDPRFDQLPAKYIRRELASLQAVRESLDALVKDGRDLSEGAMDSMLKDGREGKRDTLRDRDGSAADELFRGGKQDTKTKEKKKKKSGSSIFDEL